MKCKYCGGRSFNITIEAFQRVDYDKDNKIIEADTFEFGDMIKKNGWSCNTCGKELKFNEVVKG